jgi:D-xylose transport system substrate-binding protein
MEQAITAVGANGFNGVYVANDGMASGAIAALKGARIDPASKPVTGQDAEVAAIQRILVGEQLMTVYQPIKKIAETAAELAVDLVNGKASDASALATAKVNNGKKDVPSVLLDTVVVTKSNIKSTVIADGFLTPAQICTGQYKQACQAAGISTS